MVLVIGGAAIFLGTKSPAYRPAPDLKVESTPEQIERGRYLVENVANCLHCHSQLDETKYGMPIKEATKGAGGRCFTHETGFPGNMCAKNITPHPEHGLGKWTDGEISRAIREGVDKQNQPIFPLMPYTNYRHMSDEDTSAMIAYLRSLPPVAGQWPDRVLDFPLPIVVKFQPQPITAAVAAPDKSNTVAYGRYLINVAGCETCHTPVDAQHQPLPGMAFAGGQVFPLKPGAAVVSSNITMHETGLGNRTRENFIAMFRAYASPESHNVAADSGKNTVMPWLGMSGMTDEDLGAIYDYLKTVPPVANKVEKFAATPPT
ncbi:MAG TPA: c-type cytochrome [Longimicrobium sp.]